MQLRHALERVVALDDERRSISNEIQRTMDRLGKAVLGSDRFGVDPDRITSLGKRLSRDSDETSALKGIMTDICSRIVDDTVSRTHRMQRSGSAQEMVDSLRHELASSLTHAQVAVEQGGRLAYMISRRTDINCQLTETKSGVATDEETQELLDVILAARNSASEYCDHDSLAFLAKAESSADQDADLNRIASEVSLIRGALADGEEAEVPADLVDLVVRTAMKLRDERDELHRRLESLTRTVESQQEMSHGLMQSVTKASEVVDLAVSLQEELDKTGKVQAGALGPLKIACLEHGVMTLILTLRRHRVDRESLDRAVAELSVALGDLFSAIAHRPDLVKGLAGVWDDLAFADAAAIEAEWDEVYANVLGVRMEANGMLSVSPEDLAKLAGADGLDHWLDQLVSRLDEKLGEMTGLVERFESVDRALDALIEKGEYTNYAQHAKKTLARFVGEVSIALSDYYSRIHMTLTEPTAGVRRVQAEIAGFGHVEALSANSSAEERNQAFMKTLKEVATLFRELEVNLPMELNAADWLKVEHATREEAESAHLATASAAARARRMRGILFPPVTDSCREALRVASLIRRDWSAAMASLQRDGNPSDRICDALQALHVEEGFYDRLQLPRDPGRDVSRLAADRWRRLLDLHGSSVVLLFAVLQVAAEEYHQVPAGERDEHVAWMEELLGHAASQLRLHVQCLDDCLFEVTTEGEREAHFMAAFDAYHGWAKQVADTDAGQALLDRVGDGIFEQLEGSLGRFGARSLDHTRPDERLATSRLEGLLDLYRRLERALDGRPTKTDLRGQLAAQRERAESLQAGTVTGTFRIPVQLETKSMQQL